MVGYRQTNQKTDTGKTLTRWPVFVDHFNRHAQPEPVVSAEMLHTAASAIEDLLTTNDRTGACVWFDLPFRLRSAANAQPAPVVPEEKPIPNTLSMYAVDAVAAIAEVKGWNACRAAMLAAAPQEVKGE